MRIRIYFFHRITRNRKINRPLTRNKRVFGLVIDFGTSQSPKSTRPLTTYLCPSRPGHQALRNNFASSLLLRTWLPYDWTPRSEAYFVFPLAQGTPGNKRVFDLVIDFGTSQSPKSTRPLTTYSCPSRPGHQALRNNFASSLLLRTWLPMTGRRVWMPTLLTLWRYAHDG
ncbi:hypothetical protein [Thiolapillus sp.]|uniref:hypothetical protein n=3 Tax=Thiolapillus sp. TaxID=2017437 RepID=UPI003AF95DE8